MATFGGSRRASSHATRSPLSQKHCTAARPPRSAQTAAVMGRVVEVDVLVLEEVVVVGRGAVLLVEEVLEEVDVVVGGSVEEVVVTVVDEVVEVEDEEVVVGIVELVEDDVEVVDVVGSVEVVEDDVEVEDDEVEEDEDVEVEDDEDVDVVMDE